jgi:hypothetical protein
MTLPFFRSIVGPLSPIPNSLVLEGLSRSQIGVGAGSGLWRMEQRMLILWHLEVNVNGVPERIESADVIVWSEGSGFAQQIAAGPHRLRAMNRKASEARYRAISLRLFTRRSGFLHIDDGRDVCATKEVAVGTGHGLASTFEDIRCRLRRMWIKGRYAQQNRAGCPV